MDDGDNGLWEDGDNGICVAGTEGRLVDAMLDGDSETVGGLLNTGEYNGMELSSILLSVISCSGFINKLLSSCK